MSGEACAVRFNCDPYEVSSFLEKSCPFIAHDIIQCNPPAPSDVGPDDVGPDVLEIVSIDIDCTNTTHLHLVKYNINIFSCDGSRFMVFRKPIIDLLTAIYPSNDSEQQYLATLPVLNSSFSLFRRYIVKLSREDNVDIVPFSSEFSLPGLPIEIEVVRKIIWHVFMELPFVNYVYVHDKYVFIIHNDSVLTVFDGSRGDYKKIGSVQLNVDWSKIDFVDDKYYKITPRGEGDSVYEVTLSFSQNCPADCDGCEYVDLTYTYTISIDNGIKILDKKEEYDAGACQDDEGYYDDDE